VIFVGGTAVTFVIGARIDVGQRPHNFLHSCANFGLLHTELLKHNGSFRNSN